MTDRRTITVTLPDAIATAEGETTRTLRLREPRMREFRRLEDLGHMGAGHELSFVADMVEICCEEPPLTRANVDEMTLADIRAVSVAIGPFGLTDDE